MEEKNLNCLIEYENVSIYQKDSEVLTDVSFRLMEKDFLYIVGKVGTGKSSLLKTVYAELPIESGRANVLDYDIATIKSSQIPDLRRMLGIVFQDFQLLTDRTVHDNLEFVLEATDWSNKREISTRIMEALNQVDMYHRRDRMPHQLSGGEQQRVVIARALLNFPRIILADEPTGNLDPETGMQILELLHNIRQTGTTVIMCTHNYGLVETFPSRIIKCEGGTIQNISVNDLNFLRK
jgi:cell division transport system ATP-binding protein